MPLARALLAACAADPPRRRTVRYRFGETGERFVGARVRQLRRLYRSAEPALDTPEWRRWLVYDVERAIADAVESGALRDAAA